MSETFSTLDLDKENVKAFMDLCNLRGIVCKVSAAKYIEMRDEYRSKVNWWKEVQKCVNWLYDNELKKISRARLRNWMTKSIQFQKDYEMRQQQRFADKRHQNGIPLSTTGDPTFTNASFDAPKKFLVKRKAKLVDVLDEFGRVIAVREEFETVLVPSIQ